MKIMNIWTLRRIVTSRAVGDKGALTGRAELHVVSLLYEGLAEVPGQQTVAQHVALEHTTTSHELRQTLDSMFSWNPLGKDTFSPIISVRLFKSNNGT